MFEQARPEIVSATNDLATMAVDEKLYHSKCTIKIIMYFRMHSACSTDHTSER